MDFCSECLFEAYVVWLCFAIVQPFVQCVRIVGNKFSKAEEFNSVLNEVMIDEGPTHLSDNVIAAATTYLVILLQFTDETPSPTPPVRSPNYPY
ncbi:unnamed protein product [Nezara viridula]|uniref:Uncharacterized protein n=1 Tax=Nezara viridula TaxID=85310 RepID=A0A9P0EGJ7_NEZVI|nr:unnamed protein product [Nezara viridula]